MYNRMHALDACPIYIYIDRPVYCTHIHIQISRYILNKWINKLINQLDKRMSK